MDQKVRANRTIAEAQADAEVRFAAANPKSKGRHEKAARFLPGGNTRAVLWYPPFPLAFAKGEGAYLYDMDGHHYVDMVAEQSAGIFGHSDSTIRKAIDAALDGGINLGGPNVYEADLAEIVCQRFPNIERVRFTNSGSEANLMAVAAARAFTGRGRILVFSGGYHGSGLAFPVGPAVTNPPFDAVIATYNDIEGTVAQIEANAAQLACVLLEPMMGGGGCIAATPEFLRALRAACDRHGVLLVFDEVMTSRLAPGGLQGATAVTPDLTALGKYVGGGMSFGAFGGRADIIDRFNPALAGYFHHAGTFNNNVLTMAAGIVGMRDVYTREKAVELNAAGDRLRERLEQAGTARSLPVQVTGVGSLMNIHFSRKPIRTPADVQASNIAARGLMHLEMMLRGVYMARRGFLALSLPLTAADLDQVVQAFDDFLQDNSAMIDRET